MDVKTTLAEKLVLEAYAGGVRDQKGLQKIKKKFAAIKRGNPLANVELIEAYKNLIGRKQLPDNSDFWKVLRKRGVRSQSGIASITVLTKHYPCPGNCIFCPNEPDMPKSYLSNEPAVMRAILNDFDPYRQTISRIRGLNNAGHFTDKVDVIVSGGTFSFYKHRYQTDFVRSIFNALNYPKKKERSLIKAQKINETAANRCIGLSIETRPDHINEKELIRLRSLGCTKIEMGLQSLNDEVLRMNNRGHSVSDAVRAIKLIKDAGFKINCHMMPNLYGSSMENDINDFRVLFEDPAFRPDWLKIYPCMVVPWSKLEILYKKGRYVPYTNEELINLMIKIKQLVPKYTRITRLYRDIPATSVIGGSKVSNIRQVIQKEMEKRNIKCNCIRCREIKGMSVNFDDLVLNVSEFKASEGREFFITYEDPGSDKLCALLRLRITSYTVNGGIHFIKELNGAAIIREVHTYGEHVKVSKNQIGASQHIGLGRRMIQKAEDIAKQNGIKKLAVISGIGVREYYRKLGYRLEGTYMVKWL